MMEEIRECEHKAELQEPHLCPYAEEINNDSVTQCRCCDFCQNECARDI